MARGAFEWPASKKYATIIAAHMPRRAMHMFIAADVLYRHDIISRRLLSEPHFGDAEMRGREAKRAGRPAWAAGISPPNARARRRCWRRFAVGTADADARRRRPTMRGRAA